MLKAAHGFPPELRVGKKRAMSPTLKLFDPTLMTLARKLFLLLTFERKSFHLI